MVNLQKLVYVMAIEMKITDKVDIYLTNAEGLSVFRLGIDTCWLFSAMKNDKHLKADTQESVINVLDR